MAKPNVRFTAWSPSRLADYDQCPFMAMHKHLLKTCPECFKGKITGGYKTPAICDSCGKTLVKAPALVRGGEIGDNLDRLLSGGKVAMKLITRHPVVEKIVKQAKADIKKGIGAIQIDVTLTKEFTPCQGWDRSAWLRGKLDYRRVTGTLAHVTDWKTGGIDRDTGEVKANDKYDDQLLTYNTVTLSTLPDVEEVTSDLVFLDAGPRFPAVVARDGLKRKDLKKAQAKLIKKALPMLSDDSFSPRANGSCRWCDFSKGKGGPCRY